MPGDYAAAFRSVEEEDPELLELENEAREKEQVTYKLITKIL